MIELGYLADIRTMKMNENFDSDECSSDGEESDANESQESVVQYDADVLDEDEETNAIDESDEIYKNIDSHNILCHEIALEQHSTNEISWQKHNRLLDIYQDEPHNKQLIYLIAVTNNKNDKIKSDDVKYVGISKTKVRVQVSMLELSLLQSKVMENIEENTKEIDKCTIIYRIKSKKENSFGFCLQTWSLQQAHWNKQ